MAFNVLKEVQEFHTDFIAGSVAIASEPFSLIQGNSAPAPTFSPSVDPYFGILNLSTGAVANGYSILAIDASQFILNKRPYRAHVQFQIPVLANAGVQDFQVFMGFDSSMVGTGTASVSAARFRTTVANAIVTDLIAASTAVGGSPNTETPLGATGLVAATWYNWYIQADFINTQTQLTYGNLVAGPTVGIRQWLIPDLGLNPSFPGVNQFNAFTQGYMGEYPLTLAPTANLGFVIGISSVTGTTPKSLLINRATVLADRWNPGN